ncbi:MAG: ATPase P [Chloroflexota bacterium]|jgi:soluble P-type ATPase
MIALDIPGTGAFELHHVVMDYNGTLAVDGVLLDGLAHSLTRLAEQLQLHVVTADTFGLARGQLAGLPCQLTVLPPGRHAQAKRDYVRALGPMGCVAIGNGRNDRLMLEAAAIGILLIQAEGAAGQALLAADVVCRDARDALALLLEPRRLIATLRD